MDYLAPQTPIPVQTCSFCNREPVIVLCITCGHTFTGRVRTSCNIHPEFIHLMDYTCCPKCMCFRLKECGYIGKTPKKDRSAVGITSPNISQNQVRRSLASPTLTSPLQSPAVKIPIASPTLTTPVKSPTVIGPDIRSPALVSPTIRSPTVTSPTVKSPALNSLNVKSQPVDAPIRSPTVASPPAPDQRSRRSLSSPTKEPAKLTITIGGANSSSQRIVSYKDDANKPKKISEVIGAPMKFGTTLMSRMDKKPLCGIGRGRGVMSVPISPDRKNHPSLRGNNQYVNNQYVNSSRMRQE